MRNAPHLHRVGQAKEGSGVFSSAFPSSQSSPCICSAACLLGRIFGLLFIITTSPSSVCPFLTLLPSLCLSCPPSPVTCSPADCASSCHKRRWRALSSHSLFHCSRATSTTQISLPRLPGSLRSSCPLLRHNCSLLANCHADNFTFVCTVSDLQVEVLCVNICTRLLG